MLFGFVRSDLALGDATVIVALLLTVAAPAAGGVMLLRAPGGRRSLERREQLRQQVLEAEVLRLAAERGNRMTVIELVTELSLTAEDAKATLDGMMRRGLADLEVTESGGLVYTFPDLQHLAERDRSKGLLDA